MNPGTRDTEAARRKREKQLLALIALLAGDLDKIGSQLARNVITATQAAQQAQVVLHTSHVRAAGLGVLLAHEQGLMAMAAAGAGLVGALGSGANVTVQQTEFLRGYLKDLAAGRYNPNRQGGEGAKARRVRSGLYGKRLLGTANRAWLRFAMLSGQEVRWVLGPNEKHCPDCVYEDSLEWRSASTLTRVPGEGKTVCLVNCRCVLLTRSGLEGFNLLKQAN